MVSTDEGVDGHSGRGVDHRDRAPIGAGHVVPVGAVLPSVGDVEKPPAWREVDGVRMRIGLGQDPMFVRLEIEGVNHVATHIICVHSVCQRIEREVAHRSARANQLGLLQRGEVDSHQVAVFEPGYIHRVAVGGEGQTARRLHRGDRANDGARGEIDHADVVADPVCGVERFLVWREFENLRPIALRWQHS